MRDWLPRTCPTRSGRRVVHGDYKLDNAIVQRRAAPGRGSPRSSTGRWRRSATRAPTSATCCRSGRSRGRAARPMGAAGRRRAAGSRPARSWSRAGSDGTGRDRRRPRWFIALAIWKLAVLLEASYHRWLAGMADDPFFATLDVGVPALLARARERWPVPEPARRSVVDWGGVLTTDLGAAIDGVGGGGRHRRRDYQAAMRRWLGAGGEQEARCNPVHALERGEMEVPDFEERLAAGADASHGAARSPPTGLVHADVRALRARPRHGRAGAPRPRAGAAYGAAVELVGQRLPARRLGRDVRRRRHLRRGRHAQARAARSSSTRWRCSTSTPAECVFVDDLPRNVAGGRRARLRRRAPHVVRRASG